MRDPEIGQAQAAVSDVRQDAANVIDAQAAVEIAQGARVRAINHLPL